MKFLAAAGILTILLVAGHAAALTYSAAEVEAVDVDSSGGELVAIRTQSTSNGPGIEMFSLDGFIRVEEDYSNRTGTGPNPLQPEQGTRLIVEGAVDIASRDFGQANTIFIQGQGASVNFETSSWIASQASGATKERTTPLDERPEMATSIDGTAEISNFEEPISLVIQGAFSVGIWDWSGTYHASGESGDLWAGIEDNSIDPTASDGVIRDRVAKLYFLAEEATLRITLQAAALEQLFVADVDAEAGSVVLRNATLLGSNEAGQTVTMTDSAFSLVPEQGGLTIEFPEPQSAPPIVPPGPSVDDADPEPAGVVGETSPSLPAWVTWGVVFVAALLAVVLVVLVAKQRRQRLLEALRDAMEFGVFDLVADSAPKLFRSKRYGEEAGMMHVAATLHVGGVDEARTALASLPPRARLSQPAAHYVRACIEAHAGDADQAKHELQACLAGDDSFEDEAASNPLLGPILHRLRSASAPSDGTEFA